MLTVVSDPADFSDSVSICPRETVSVATALSNRANGSRNT